MKKISQALGMLLDSIAGRSASLGFLAGRKTADRALIPEAPAQPPKFAQSLAGLAQWLKPSHRRLAGRIAMGLGLALLLAMGAKAMINLTGTFRLTPLAVTVNPQGDLPQEEQAMESQTVGLAFDRDTTTTYTAFGKSQVRVTFEGMEEIHSLRLFDAAPYVVNISAVDAQGNQSPVSEWTNLDLGKLGTGWNEVDLAKPVNASSLVLTLSPSTASGSAGIEEIEFWGKGVAQNQKDALAWDTLLKASPTPSPNVLLSGREYAADKPIVTVGGVGNPATATFHVNLPMDGKNYRRAWLMYEVTGLSHWIAVPRTINGSSAPSSSWQGGTGMAGGEAAGGWPLPGSDQWSTQSEPIHPMWLSQGDNTLTFSTPLGVVSPYQVRNLKIVVEEDNGANLIDTATATSADESGPVDEGDLLDGDETTGWEPYVDGGADPGLTLDLYRTVQVDRVKLYVHGNIPGKVMVGVLQGGIWKSLGDAVNGSGLASGWQDVAVKAQGPVDSISLQFTGGSGSGGIMEAMVEGSGVGHPYGPTVEVTYPDEGQFFGREAYIRGFLGVPDNGSGAAKVILGSKTVKVMNGQFEGIVAKEDVGLSGQADGDSWAVTVVAMYPDGTQVQKVVGLNQPMDQAPPSGAQSFSTYAEKVKGGEATVIDKMGARIEMLKNSLGKTLDLKVVALSTVDLPAMNPGMTNVTGGKYRGYRFLPHGTQFKNKVKMTLPYDAKLLPSGKKASDVRTYFFDTNRGTWMPLELVGVDEPGGKVQSLTNHFTDFVNATITTPSNPQEANFNPNQMKDIKAADPGAEVNLIDPPQANNNGTANLNYPIEVPPGRKGIQPQLSVAYNSSNGDSWMGMGWDLPIQSVKVETRWGVPRYWDGTNGNPNVETETYSLNGEMLTEVLPGNPSYLAHRVSGFAPRPASDPVTFHTRTEGQFRLILRHGTSPSTYWWEVTDKTGNKSFFGGNPDIGGTPNPNAVLTDGAGHIFEWAMNEMKDPHGNSMQYAYDVVTIPSGKEIYYNNITYTGTNAVAGPYKVQFFHGQGSYVSGGATVVQSRPDVTLNSRGGFTRATGDVLDHVSVQLNGAEIRSYKFVYASGAFQKTLLQSVQQFGPNGEVFAGNTHSFKYFNEVQASPGATTYNGFTLVGWTPPSSGVQDSFLNVVSANFLDGKPTILGGDENTGIGGHIYVGYSPPGTAGKQFSGGFKVGFNGSLGDGQVQFMDINGDGLPDLVFKSNGTLMYLPNLGGAHGTPSFGTTPLPITGINEISQENSIMFSFGPEIYIAGVNGLLNFSTTTNNHTTYFTDVNGDGIPDLVNGGSVFFGHAVLSSTGAVTAVSFAGDTGSTANPLCAGGSIQTTNLVPDFTNQFTQAVTQDPLVDNLRQWTAPFTGTVTLTAPLTLASGQPAGSDGVRAEVEKDTGTFPGSGSTLAATLISPSQAGTSIPLSATVSVNKGDRIYFRLQSLFDGRLDQVAWDPKINYSGITQTVDPNNLNPAAYQASKDFTLAGRRNISVNMPNSGAVTLGGDITKTGTTSDSVTLVVIKNVTNSGSLTSAQTIYSVTIPGSQTGTIAISSGTATSGNVTVDTVNHAVSISGIVNNLSNTPTAGTEMDQLQFLFMADSNIDLSKIQWSPIVGYTSIVPARGGTAAPPASPATLKAPYDIEFYPETNLTAPQAPFIATGTSLSITPSLALSAGGPASGTVILTAKSNGLLLAKQAYVLTAGSAAVTTPAMALTGLTAGQTLFFNLSVRDETMVSHLATSLSAGTTVLPFSRDSAGAPVSVFASPYRGWSYAGLKADGTITNVANNTNGASPTTPLNESDLQLPASSSFSTSTPSNLNNPNDPSFQQAQGGQNAMKAVILYPDQSTGVWMGPTTEIFVGPGVVESSRYAMDKISLVVDPSQLGGSAAGGTGTVECGSGAVGVPRVDQTNQTTFGAGFYLSGSLGSGSTNGILDFMDLNGDGYPDIVGQTNTQYTLPTGGLEANSRGVNALAVSSSNAVSNIGLGGNAAQIFDDGGDNDRGSGTEDNGSVNSGGDSKGSGSQMSSLGVIISAGLGGSSSNQQSQLIDMNGDGLPDKVRLDSNNHLFVALNLGYGFDAERDWTPPVPVIRQTGSTSLDGGLAFNDGIYGFAGGINASGSSGSVPLQLADINGDGLPDVVQTNPSGGYLVWINEGSGFASTPITWTGGSGDLNQNKSQGVGTGGYFTINIVLGPYGSIIINPGADVSHSMGSPQAALQDINGDGYPDQVLSPTDGAVTVFQNNWGRTNLLQEVDRPLGAKINLDYTRDGNVYQNPHSRWNLSKVTVFDGGQNGNATAAPAGADFQLTTYDYALGVAANGQTIAAYDRFEREFLGYGAVTQTQFDTKGITSAAGLTAATPYRQVIEAFLNYNFYEKGLMTVEQTNDVSGATPKPFLEMDNTYQLEDINNTGTPVSLTAPSLTVPTNTLFPQLVNGTKKYFEGGTGTLSTTQTMGYDSLGNVTTFSDSGDAAEPDSAVSVAITYSITDPTLAPSYIVGLPENLTVTNPANQVVRSRAATYTSFGDLAQVRQFLADGTSAQVDITYDSTGMPVSQLAPVNAQGFRQALNYQWDSTIHNYPTTITDGLGYTTEFAYDFRFGKPVTETDENNKQIQTSFDDFGRPATMIGPFEADPANNFHGHFTIAFDYHPDAAVPYGHTEHFDPYRNPGDPIETLLFTDGLKRVIQTKKDDTIFQATNRAPLDEMTVSGRVVYDQVGRMIAQFYPVVEAKGSNNSLNTGYDPVTPTTMTFDILDRNLRTTIPDNTHTDMAFDISTDNGPSQFRTTVTDANGKAKKTYRDVRELIKQVNEFLNNGSQVITTSYAYDAMRQITQVLDANGNATTLAYDNLGRRTVLDNPDAGKTTMAYDLASNMVKKITANLANEGGSRAIQYRYDADNRLTNILYPDFPSNNVIYTYGIPGATGNTANRINLVMDASGSEQRTYDDMGNVAREVKILTPLEEVDEPFQFIPAGGCVTCASQCVTCGVSSMCSTCFGGWDAGGSGLSLTNNNNGWGRTGLSLGSASSTITQGQWVGWGTSNNHTMESAGMPMTFVTQFVFDTWGRIQNMTYPDGEVLTYAYDSGGLPRSVTGMVELKNIVFPYVLRLEYDKFEQKEFVQNGNGTQNQYSYNPQNRRLANLEGQTGSGNGSGHVTFQNLNYSYDNVGNVTQLANQIAPMPGFLLGGPVTQNYGYDDLYRLTHADGNTHAIYDPSCGSTYDSGYALNMTYDNIHNILEKSQAATFTQVDNSNHLTILGPDTRLTYDWNYSYNGPQPHAPTQIGQRQFFYDDNGNQVGYDVLATDTDPNDSHFGANRNVVWDEENRIFAIGDDDPGVRATNFGDTHFLYDDQGTRVMKIQGGDITAYINQFYVVEKPQGVNASVGSKHIFIGMDRIASQIVNPKDDQTLVIDASINTCPACAASACMTCGVNLVTSSNMGWGRRVNPLSQTAGSSGQSDASDDQVQFVTALSDGVTIYDNDSFEANVVGTVDSCETLTLRTLDPYTNFYEVQYNGQPAFVSADAVTVGLPASCKGVWPSSSVMPEDYFTFFYHPDHLGSTGYMSDSKGALTEHIEYIPFGESWIEQRQGLQLFPSYQFTGKEIDPETGLYYYGARYYDPRTSVWQSPDPVLNEYLPDAGGFESDMVMGGFGSWKGRGKRVYRSLNLNLYGYALQNPLLFTDLNGDRPLTPGEVKLAQSVFGNSIDYSKTEIFADVQRAITNPITKNIHMDKAALVDVSTQPLDDRATFIHEMTHVRQSQTLLGGLGLAIRAGVGHAWAAVKGFFIGLFTSKTIAFAIWEEDNKLYDFQNEKVQPLGGLGDEQQAFVVQRNYEKGELLKLGLPVTKEQLKAEQIMLQTPNFPKSFDK